MNHLKTAGLAAATALLLSGCGLLNSFVPDQEVEDAFGLDGEPVTLVPAPAEGLAPAILIASAAYEGPLSGSFGDVVLPDSVPAGIRPSSIEEELHLRSSITITTDPGTTLPATLTIEGVDVTLSVGDDSSDPDVSEDFTSSVSIELTGSCDATGVCSYTVASADADAVLLTLALSGADFRGLWDLLQNEAEPNVLTGTMTLEFAEAFAASSIEIVLETEGGTLKFG